MKAECIPFDKIPHTSKLFQDFVGGSATRFYPRSINFKDWVAGAAREMKFDPARREAIAKILRSQNTAWGASPKTLENIERLNQGAHVVVTGQQVALFGGPLFSILKAITAIKLAEEARQKGVDAVPIFWLATEDHDFAEVSHVNLLRTGAASIQSVGVTAGGVEGAPVGARPLHEDVAAAVSAASDALGDSEISALLQKFYRPGQDLGSAMGNLFARLFAEHGLILLDPSGADAHRLAAPVFA